MRNATSRLLRRWAGMATIIVLVAGVAACDIDEIFNVQNPGRILDEDLNTPLGLNALVRGASAEASDIFDILAFGVARVTDEAAGSGSYFDTGLLRRGILDYREMDGYFEQAQEARWAAEEAIRRFDEVLGEAEAQQDTAYARAFVLSGMGHQALGESFCELVYESSGRLPRDTAFDRALAQFERGEALADALGNTNLVNAARAGQAAALAGLAWAGEATWEEAASIADQVPTDFAYYAYYDVNDNVNIVWDETHDRHEMSMFGTIVADLPTDNPRAPWTDCTVEGACSSDVGADGVTPHYRQEKYPDEGGDIPRLSGLEARMIEAEYYLIQGDLVSFISEINQARDHFGLADLPVPADQEEAWAILDTERFLNLWLTGKRLWDLHRWDTDDHAFTLFPGSRAHDFVYGGGIVYPTDPALERRDTCMPVPFSECQANPNVNCET